MNKGTWLLSLCLGVAGCGQDSSEPKVSGRWYTQSQVELGRKVYALNCVGCHLDNAQGTASWKDRSPDGSYPPPPLNGSAHTWHHPLAILKKVIDEGGVPLGGKMPGFKDKLNEEEKLAVISYFQSFWSGEIYDAWITRGGLK